MEADLAGAKSFLPIPHTFRELKASSHKIKGSQFIFCRVENKWLTLSSKVKRPLALVYHLKCGSSPSSLP